MNANVSGTVDAAVNEYLEQRNVATAPAAPPPAPSEAPAPEQAGAEVKSEEVPAEQVPASLDMPQDQVEQAVTEISGVQPPSEDTKTGDPDEQIEAADLASDDPAPTDDGIDWNIAVPIKDADGERTVTLEQLRREHMLQADYTRKTQKIAEERKSLKDTQTQIVSDHERYIQGIDQMQAALAAQEPPEPDPTLKEIDPLAYLEAQDERRAHMERKQAFETHRAEEIQKFQQNQQTVLAQQVERSRQELISTIPDLADEAKMQKFIQDNRSYMLGEGFSEAEANQVFDHRALIQIDKARRYDIARAKALARKSQTPVVSPSVGQSQTVHVPESATSTEVQQAEERLSHDNSIDAAVDLLLTRKDQATA